MREWMMTLFISMVSSWWLEGESRYYSHLRDCLRRESSIFRILIFSSCLSKLYSALIWSRISFLCISL
jgi:hypothetical protein